ncbi:MAG TPA: hypothetical protein VE135_25880 [Pyrinomonadaceae bacterium]|nr:hypothetical protein [Pyrinomonadaceae bacterium]
MPKFQVLYYPTFEPPELWLRGFLLFFDEVITVVPPDAGFRLSDNAARLLDLLPESFNTIAPSRSDIEIDQSNLDRLRKAFSQIARSVPKADRDSISFEIGHDGSVRIEGHIFLHYSKTSKEVYDLLKEFGLVKRELSGVPEVFGLTEGYSVVNEDASLLLLSHIADKIGDRNGIATITDQTFSFSVNALNALTTIHPSGSPIKLASSIINLQIPEEVLFADPKKFKELRDAYQDIRLPFQQMTLELSQLYRLDAINDPEVLQVRIDEIARYLDAELQKLKKSAFGRQVKRWSPIGIGSLATIAGAVIGDPAVAITSAVLSISVQIVQELIGKVPAETSQDKVQRLLGKLQKDILNISEVKRLA